MWSWSPSVVDDVDHERVIVGGVSGTAFINVALNGAQTISDTLNSIKAKVVQAQDPTQDHNAIQNDITAFINQIDCWLPPRGSTAPICSVAAPTARTCARDLEARADPVLRLGQRLLRVAEGLEGSERIGIGID
jgi:hypothetical protein